MDLFTRILLQSERRANLRSIAQLGSINQFAQQFHFLRPASSVRLISSPNELLLSQTITSISRRFQSSSTPPEKPAPVLPPMSTVVKVRPRKLTATDYAASYTENNFITAMRAMHEYLLKPSDLEALKQYKTRSPDSDVVDNLPKITVYRRRDVENRAYEVWGSPEALNKEKARLAKARQEDYEALFSFKKSLKEYEKRLLVLENASFDVTKSSKNTILSTGGGKVVVTAVLINAANALVKTIGWFFTGSASLFSEAIHSMADTCNQLILTFGLWKSIKKPSPEHPYGYSNMTYISSLISGVGIFCFGTGVAWYHGVSVLLHPQEVESMFLGLALLSVSLISEGVTLHMAVKEIREAAQQSGMQFWEYVRQGYKPDVNVVLLEDLAAVLGVCVAGTAMSFSIYLQSPIPDAIGSLIIGGILGGVASFIIYSNTAALVGRSIHPNQLEAINKDLESDRMVRALYDIKATDMGSQHVMFKAEVDVDGREIARSYLEKLDIQSILAEIQKIDSIELAEAFLLKHGESIVDRLGAEMDRIERNLRKKHPSLRHVDLEVL